MQKDLFHNISGRLVLLGAPGTGEVESNSVDSNGDFESQTFLVGADGVAAGTFSLVESDDNVTFTDVADVDIIGEKDTDVVAGQIAKVGYIGSKQYVKVKTNLSFDGDLAITCVLSHARMTSLND